MGYTALQFELEYVRGTGWMEYFQALSNKEDFDLNIQKLTHLDK